MQEQQGHSQGHPQGHPHGQRPRSDAIGVTEYLTQFSDVVAHDVPGESDVVTEHTLMECSLCDTPVFSYPRFFVESQHSGYVWGRVCPREGCTYVLCYLCVLRLPAPAFACPACRFEMADTIGIPEALREWREEKDKEQAEFQLNYDLLYEEHRRFIRRSQRGGDNEGDNGTHHGSRDSAITNALLRALVARANSAIVEETEGGIPAIALAIDIPDSDQETDSEDMSWGSSSDSSDEEDDGEDDEEDVGEDDEDNEEDVEDPDDSDYVPTPSSFTPSEPNSPEATEEIEEED